MDKRYGILIVSVTIFVLSFAGTASAANWTVDDSGGADFTGIQEAINKASVGDTIIVHSGVYYENVVVDKSVTLKGIGYPIVDANGSGSAIKLSADGITLVGFTATNSRGVKVISCNNNISGNNVSNNYNGIELRRSNNNTITGNNVSNNSRGIELCRSSNNNTITGNNVCYNALSISLSNCCNNTITGNNVSNNSRGIDFRYRSSNNNISSNTICNNKNDGIYFYDSCNNNTITGNRFVNDGLFVVGSYQNTVENNTVNGKPLVYLEDVLDYKVEDAGQVILVNCNNITVENQDLSNTSVGIELLNTENSNALNNTASNNRRAGIYLYDSSNNNTITGNTVSNNSGYGGIALYDSSNNNSITGNNVSSNFSNDMYSISLHDCCNNTIIGNNVCNNRYGIYLSDSSNNNSITGNNVSNNGDGIELCHSCNNTISGNNVSNNYWGGIELCRSSNNNSITGNNVSNNGNGIALCHSCNNTIAGNNVCNNRYDGIYLSDSSNNNQIYLNDFISGSWLLGLTNILNTPEKITYTYNGSTHKSHLGNYWGDYKEKYPDAEEIDSRGIWDIPYSIDGDEDSYPLMQQRGNYHP